MGNTTALTHGEFNSLPLKLFTFGFEMGMYRRRNDRVPLTAG